jgi:holo-[acyl-carrier protein] synthase
VIHGIGTDIVDCARFETMFSRHGGRLADRMLSERELPECRADQNPARFIAKRFAAKEAFSKAVGSGLREPVSLRRITITNDDLGKPVLMFDDMLRAHLAQLGITGHHLSISDEQNTIVAFVVLETS